MPTSCIDLYTDYNTDFEIVREERVQLNLLYWWSPTFSMP